VIERKDRAGQLAGWSTEELEAVRHAALGLVPSIENFAALDSSGLLTPGCTLVRPGSDRHLEPTISTPGCAHTAPIRPERVGLVWEKTTSSRSSWIDLPFEQW